MARLSVFVALLAVSVAIFAADAGKVGTLSTKGSDGKIGGAIEVKAGGSTGEIGGKVGGSTGGEVGGKVGGETGGKVGVKVGGKVGTGGKVGSRVKVGTGGKVSGGGKVGGSIKVGGGDKVTGGNKGGVSGKTGGSVQVGNSKNGAKVGGKVAVGVRVGVKVGVKSGSKSGGRSGGKKGGKKGGTKPSSDSPKPSSDSPKPSSDSPKPSSESPKPTGVKASSSSPAAKPTSNEVDSISNNDNGDVKIKGSTWASKQCPRMLALKYKGACTPANCSKAGVPAKWKESLLISRNLKKYASWAPLLKCPHGGWRAEKPTPEACCNQCAASPKCTYWQFVPALNGLAAQCSLIGTEMDFECGDLSAQYEGKDKPVYLQIRAGGECNDHTEVINDPHFLGAHGTRFDFNGRPDKAFCLLTDDNVHVNMLLRGYLDERTEGASLVVDGKAVHTWIKELGVVWHSKNVDHKLRVVARGGKQQERGTGFMQAIEVDGSKIERLQLGEEFHGDGGLTIALRGYEKEGPYEVDHYTVSIDGIIAFDLRLRVAHPALQTPNDAEVHINVAVTSFDYTENVHGVLGQTFREDHIDRAMDFQKIVSSLHRPISADGKTGEGFLDGTPRSYESAGVLSVDCAMTAYKRAIHLSAINRSTA